MLTLFALLPLSLASWVHRRERGTVAGMGWVIPVAMGAASLIGKLFGNKKKNKEKQAAFDAAKAKEAEELPLRQAAARAAARKNNVRNSLRWSIAKAYGFDKIMPELYGTRPEMEQEQEITNSFDKMKRPGGFSWGDFAGDAAGTVASTLGSGSAGGAQGGSNFFNLGSAIGALGKNKPPATLGGNPADDYRSEEP